MATGGITPDKVAGWLEAGAAVTAMGSKLAGRDVRLLRTDKEFEEAYKEWQEKGKEEARKAIEMINKL
jgi:2-keto-3-deoxy-6-phosphogluconate aldolase